MTAKGKFKKITLPILMSAISLYVSILFFFGAIVGYALVYYLSRKIKSVRFSLGGYRIHLHHWVFSSVALTVIFISGIYNFLPVMFLGVGGGIVFHGIYCYNDWYKIVSKKQS